MWYVSFSRQWCYLYVGMNKNQFVEGIKCKAGYKDNIDISILIDNDDSHAKTNANQEGHNHTRLNALRGEETIPGKKMTKTNTEWTKSGQNAL